MKHRLGTTLGRLHSERVDHEQETVLRGARLGHDD
jgi:hypothetical protein